MKYKLGFIGCGNMASAMIGGIVKQQILTPEQIIASNRSEGKLEEASKAFGIHTTLDNVEVAKESEIVVLAVKPIFYKEIIKEIAKDVKKSQIIVTIAPGFDLEQIGYLFGQDMKIVRTMPNTPAMVCEGMTAACCNEFITEEEVKEVCHILDGFGKTEIVPERLMDAVVAVSGSSPAYIYMLIEAMADAAVAEGMPRAQAYRFASQAVLGSAKMVLETEKHPGELKDMVCSPGGTTIAAVMELEKKGFRSSVMEAMKVCADKCRGV
ncbi:MAG: pyrroline-5-carboxylate reductase [Lachnospiraceae bacterium]|nr:pyrroline-5-carboxylate reductase [Lachnospiraceae bacterium]